FVFVLFVLVFVLFLGLVDCVWCWVVVFVWVLGGCCGVLCGFGVCFVGGVFGVVCVCWVFGVVFFVVCVVFVGWLVLWVWLWGFGGCWGGWGGWGGGCWVVGVGGCGVIRD
ncbi:hypothetical protein, partial [Pseudomonas syringae group genomosp. 7]|uniref:hypothetical protein n=1 Tax=Pseudomonas syringae group genomosp. 7 TaxID=251699 RepID=UPI00376FA1A7